MNAEREVACIPALVWDDRLGKLARVWSRTMARTGRMVHSSNHYAENIVEVSDDWDPVKGGIASWLDSPPHKDL